MVVVHPPLRFATRHASVAAWFVGGVQRVGFGCTLLVDVKFCWDNLLAQDTCGWGSFSSARWKLWNFDEADACPVSTWAGEG
jgi:hypothetical protein